MRAGLPMQWAELASRWGSQQRESVDAEGSAMGILDRIETTLEKAVKSPFARVFKAEVQPVEIASAVRGAMDDRAAILGPGRTMVPNVFRVELAASDFERLASYDTALTDELVAAAEDHADAQRYTPAGTLEVQLVRDQELETGIFRVRPSSKDSKRRGNASRSRDEGSASDYPHGGGSSGGAQAAGAAAMGMAGTRRPQPAHLRGAQGIHPSGVESQDGEDHTRQIQAVSAGANERTSPTGVWLEIDGSRHSLTAAVSTLGRDPNATVTIDDQGVSRRHAEVRITNDGPHLQVIVRDLGSTNGTFVNGDEIGTEELSDGDRLTVGRTTALVHVSRGR